MTLQTRLMSKALERINAHKGKFEDKNKQKEWVEKYTTWVKSFPSLVQTSGLAQAVAFAEEKAKKEPSVRALLDDLAQTPGIDGPLLEKVKSSTVEDYAFLTQRLLDSIVFYKRFCVSVLGGEGN